jgi:hypothetical protein
MPGDNVEVEVELITPIAMDEHQRFAIREGGRTVGAGRVTKITAWAVVPSGGAAGAKTPGLSEGGPFRAPGGGRGGESGRGRGP